VGVGFAGCGIGGFAGRSVVVVEVEFGDFGSEGFDDLVEWVAAEVGVAEVEAEGGGVEVADAEDVEEVGRGGDVVAEVFEQESDAEGSGEGL